MRKPLSLIYLVPAWIRFRNDFYGPNALCEHLPPQSDVLDKSIPSKCRGSPPPNSCSILLHRVPPLKVATPLIPKNHLSGVEGLAQSTGAQSGFISANILGKSVRMTASAAMHACSEGTLRGRGPG